VVFGLRVGADVDNDEPVRILGCQVGYGFHGWTNISGNKPELILTYS
jgi:hypothetical protein